MQDKVTYRFQSGSVEFEIVRQGDYPVEKIKEEIKEIEQTFANKPAPVSQEQFKKEYEISWGGFEKEYCQYATGTWTSPSKISEKYDEIVEEDWNDLEGKMSWEED